MKLTGPQGEFELNIIDYEFADSAAFLDRNWLIVSLKTSSNGHQFNHAGPILSTWEIELLLDWMRSVAANQALSPKLTFVEPVLGFRAKSPGRGQYNLRIKLDRDVKPSWHQDESRPYWFRVKADRQQLWGAIRDLESQLQRFPVRH